MLPAAMLTAIVRRAALQAVCRIDHRVPVPLVARNTAKTARLPVARRKTFALRSANLERDTIHAGTFARTE